MSLIQKLQTALGLVFILATAGAISLNAQAQAVSDSSSATVATNGSTSNPKKAEVVTPSVPTENTESDKTSEVTRDRDNSKTFASGNAATAAKTTPAAARSGAQPAPNDKWQFQFSPYFWMAGLHGTAGTTDRTTELDESFSDIWHSLKFAFMGVFEARKDKLVVLTDLEYVSLEDDQAIPSPLFSAVNAKVKTFIFDPEVGYRVFDDPEKGAYVDVVGGVRVFHVSTDLTFSPGILPGTEVEASRTWVDGVFGLRGKADLSKKVFFTGKFDLGGGGSKFTYQLFGALGYNITPKIALMGGYRVLDVDYNKNGFIYDTNQRGPILGVGFRF